MIRRRISALSLIVAVSLGAAACSAGSDSGPDQSAQREMTIGYLAPFEGVDTARSQGGFHAVELAVEQANERNVIPGVRLKVDKKSDKSDKDVAAKAASEFAADDSVVAVVGSIYSGPSRGAAPVLAQHGIAQVSPTASNPT